jgi:hypothetical protein
MQRWEYLQINHLGRIFPASHRLQQMYQYLLGSLPHLGPKDLKVIDNAGISCQGVSMVDLMNVLGADGWEVAADSSGSGGLFYVMKRPTG